jgi:phosphatidylglycerol lysyltransferase
MTGHYTDSPQAASEWPAHAVRHIALSTDTVETIAAEKSLEQLTSKPDARPSRIAAETFASYGHNRANRRFWSPTKRSWIAFRTAGPMVIVLGGPAGEASELAALGATFEAWASPRCVVWYGAAEPRPGFRSPLLGQAAIVWPERFTLQGRPMANLRHSVAAARRWANPLTEGPWSSMAPRMRSELREIDAEWRRRHRLRLGFSLSTFEDAAADGRPWVVVSSHERVEAYVTWLPSPCGDGLVLDLMRRRSDARPGAVELALVHSIIGARERGVSWLNLGLSAHPSASSDGSCTGLTARFCPASLRAFKAKFRPNWQDRYLAVPGRIPLWLVALTVGYLHVCDAMPRPSLGWLGQQVRPRGLEHEFGEG